MSRVDAPNISWQSFSDFAKKISEGRTDGNGGAIKASDDRIIDFVKDPNGEARLIHSLDTETYNYHRAGEIRKALVNSISMVLKGSIPEDVVERISQALGYQINEKKDSFLISDKMLSERDFLTVVDTVEKQLAKNGAKVEGKNNEPKIDDKKSDTTTEVKTGQKAEEKIEDEKDEPKTEAKKADTTTEVKDGKKAEETPTVQKTEEKKGSKVDDKKAETKIDDKKADTTTEVKDDKKAEETPTVQKTEEKKESKVDDKKAETKIDDKKAEEKKAGEQADKSGASGRQKKLAENLERARRSGWKGPKASLGSKLARPFKKLWGGCTSVFSSLIGLFKKWATSAKKTATNSEVKVDAKKDADNKAILQQKCEEVLKRLEESELLKECFLGEVTDDKKSYIKKRLVEHFGKNGSGANKFARMEPKVTIATVTPEQMYSLVADKNFTYKRENGTVVTEENTFISGCRDEYVTNAFIKELKARVADAKVGDDMDATNLQRVKEYVKQMSDSEINDAFRQVKSNIKSEADLSKAVDEAFNLLSTKVESMYSKDCNFTIGNGKNAVFVSAANHPTKDTQLVTGTYFGQNTNTCFMMSYVNALMCTDEGTKIVQDYLANAEPVDKVEAGFSSFEAQLMRDYKQQMAVYEDVKNEKLGEQGVSIYMGPVFGFDQPTTKNFNAGREEMQRRTDWFKVVESLKQKPGYPVVLFQGGTNPNAIIQRGHYMAVVGTYIEDNGDYGFIVRDSLNSNERISAKNNNNVVIYMTESRNEPKIETEDNPKAEPKVDTKTEPKTETTTKAEDKTKTEPKDETEAKTETEPKDETTTKTGDKPKVTQSSKNKKKKLKT